jgi:hypothetical protein
MYLFAQKVEREIFISDAELDAADNYLQSKQRKARDQIRRHREADANGARKMRQQLIEAKGLNPERIAGLEWEAWHQRTLGKPVYKIAQGMGVTIAQVNVWLRDAMVQVQSKTQELVELDKEIELQRTETLLEQYMPVALMDDVVVERIRAGDPVQERDLEVPQHCAYVVMELIKLRCKIKGITMSQAQESMIPAIDVMGWLRTQKEFIAKTVKDAPRDVLTLEVETNIDETTEDSGITEGVPGAI